MTGRSHMFRAAALATTGLALLTATACGGSSKPAGPATSGSGSTSSATGKTSTSASPTPTPTPTTPLPPPNPAALQRVVPQPVKMVAAGGAFTIDDTTAVNASPGAEQIAAYLAGCLKQQTGVSIASGDQTSAIQLVLQPSGGDPALGSEGYQLEVTPKSVKVTAASDAGLFHGVQTLRQLVVGKTVQAGSITDYPRFGYRGAMLDVARHFFSVADVKAYIDAAALYKVNQLHLHLTDDQGWRLAVPSWPKLTSVGGSTEVGGGPGGFYTAADFKAIVDYAASRYMTVVPEIDMPGHVGAAVWSYPELACDGRSHGPITTVSPGFDALCTTNESTYRFVDSAVGAFAALNPGRLQGMGGDEAQALTIDQYNTFVKRAQDIVAGHQKQPLAWAEAGTAPLRPETVLEYWNTAVPQPFVAQAAARGTKLIMAPGDHAYLDQQPVPGFPLGLHWAGYIPVSKAYSWDPVTILPGIAPASVLGVEAPLWTETVHSLADAETLAYPRLPAIAEVGWSAPNSHDWTSFSQRLGKQAPLWNTLGIKYYRSPEIPWQ